MKIKLLKHYMYCLTNLKGCDKVDDGEMVIEKHVQQQLKHVWTQLERKPVRHQNLKQ
jgi:hypothetical protein